MKKLLGVLLLGLLVTSLAFPAFADTFTRPVDIYSEVSGLTVNEAWELRNDSDKTFGELAEENGIYEEFQVLIQAFNKERVSTLLEDGKITEDQADAWLEQIDNCDGTPGQHQGLHQRGLGGMQNGNGQGAGYGRQNGSGQGRGPGFGNRNND